MVCIQCYLRSCWNLSGDYRTISLAGPDGDNYNKGNEVIDNIYGRFDRRQLPVQRGDLESPVGCRDSA